MEQLAYYFSNLGEIDTRAIFNFGVNAKTGAEGSAIGYFGTGLKYAIAILLRENIEVEIWQGARKIVLRKKREVLRGKSFDFIEYSHDDGAPEGFGAWAPVGFTTELGKNWTVEEAYRELACNAIDEAGQEGRAPKVPLGTPGWTIIKVLGEDFANEAEASDIMLRPDDQSFAPSFMLGEDIQVFFGTSKAIYYKGVRVMALSQNSTFTYNWLRGLELTEDRTAKSPYTVERRLASAMQEFAPQSIAEAIAVQSNSWEDRLDFDSFVSPSPDWDKALEHLVKTKPTKVNASAMREFLRRRHKSLGYASRAIRPREARMIEEANAALRGVFGSQRFPVKICPDLGEAVIAMAKDGEILLTEQCFDSESKLLRSMLEEWVHLEFAVGDYSMQMQNKLFQLLLDQIGRRLGP